MLLILVNRFNQMVIIYKWQNWWHRVKETRRPTDNCLANPVPRKLWIQKLLNYNMKMQRWSPVLPEYHVIGLSSSVISTNNSSNMSRYTTLVTGRWNKRAQTWTFLIWTEHKKACTLNCPLYLQPFHTDHWTS